MLSSENLMLSPHIHFESGAPGVHQGGDGPFQISSHWLDTHLFLDVVGSYFQEICHPRASRAFSVSVLLRVEEEISSPGAGLHRQRVLGCRLLVLATLLNHHETLDKSFELA